MTFPGRIHQDDNFDVAGFEGEILEEIIGIVDEDENPILIYIKVSNKTWQKYFLDAYLAFWEDWGDIEYEEGDISIDYGNMFNIKEKRIKFIKCRDCRLIVELENGEALILKHKSTDRDSECEVEYVKKHA